MSCHSTNSSDGDSSSNPTEWTCLEKLLLSQAVYKYGENSWLEVASVLKQNALVQHRHSDFFNHKVNSEKTVDKYKHHSLYN